MAKINITMDDGLLEKVDVYADENYMSRSGLISLCCVQYLNTQEALRLVKDMNGIMRKIVDTGAVDQETRKELEDWERVCRMIVGG